MKALVLTTLVVSLFAVNVARAEEGVKGEDLQKHKEQIFKRIDQEISDLQSFKSCVSAAKDHEAMKSCREQNHERMKALRAQHDQEHRDNLDQRIKRLQDEKAKLDQKPGH